jgi:hypothetical protein
MLGELLVLAVPEAGALEAAAGRAGEEGLLPAGSLTVAMLRAQVRP